jgi:two-component system LytT family response regulator
MGITAFIVDDELKSREVLKSLLETFCQEVQVVGMAGNIADSVEAIRKLNPQLVFLDISLKEGDSFQILAQLPKISFEIIFVTAYDEYSVRALKFSGIKCLFKPIDIDELIEAVEEVTSEPGRSNMAYELADGMIKSKFTRIPVITSGGLYFADINDILYFKKDTKGTLIKLVNGDSMLSEKKVHEFAAIILSDKFCQAGINLMVNRDKVIASLTRKDCLVFTNSVELKARPEEVKEVMNPA